MNKRMKKKYELENRVRTLETHIDFLIDQNNQLFFITLSWIRGINFYG
ncbi:TPA: hypothetical protein U1D11_001317 [Streptococcus suis]|nr:hypothetical protein [Streptococcus suis]